MSHEEIAAAALDQLAIELPSWGFANTGTRFGKFLQAAAATTLEEKFADAAQVHALTGRLPDAGIARAVGPARRHRGPRARPGARAAARRSRRRDQPEPVPGSALQARLGRQPGSRGTRRGTAHTCARASTSRVSLARATSRCGSPTAPTIPARSTSASASTGSPKRSGRCTSGSRPTQRLLVEYKPFEPAFYHTDIADWGMALVLARDAGPQANVLVDTGHHYQGQNIEQIVAWLLDEAACSAASTSTTASTPTTT